MDTAEMNSIREELIQHDPTFRHLANEHKKYEMRLDELSALLYPNDDEQREESVLKKKKLALKDQMYEIMVGYNKVQATGH